MKLQKILDAYYLNKYIAPGKYIDENGNDIIIDKPELIINVEINHIKDEQIIIVLEQGKTLMFFIEEHISIIDYNKQRSMEKLSNIQKNILRQFPYIQEDDAEKILEMIQTHLIGVNKKVERYRKQASDNVQLYSTQIRGALKECINAHGPITRTFIPSATKRIVRFLMQNIDSENPIDIIDNDDE